jgi:hypothetical protein
MTPHLPYLPPVIPARQPDELFYIVKHGIKFTGMPAWPAQQRDDERWAMVAFLRRLPDLAHASTRRSGWRSRHARTFVAAAIDVRPYLWSSARVCRKRRIWPRAMTPSR